MKLRNRILLGALVIAVLLLIRWLDRKSVFPAHMRNGDRVAALVRESMTIAP